jgi:hypothetical protein
MLRKSIATAAALAALGLGVHASLAGAAAPEEHLLTGTLTVTDSTLCGFPIVMSLDYRIAHRDYLDRSGNLTRSTIHVQLVGTDSAKGVSLEESDHYTVHVDAAGNQRTTGLTMHARLPGGGLVARDAGSFTRLADGSIAFVRGPHSALLGDTAAYCAAFG